MNRFLLRDEVVNVGLYVPLGMAAYLALRRNFWLPALIGFVLSVCMEMAQLFVPGRDTSAVDVVTNVAGTIAGVGFGVIFDRLAIRSRSKLRAATSADSRPPLLLLFLWAGFLLFPFFPVLGFYVPRQRVSVFLHSAPFALVPLISGVVTWLAAGRLMEAARIRAPHRLLAWSLLAIPAQFFIVDRRPVSADLVGAAAGLCIFVFARGKGRTWIAVAFLAAILVRGVAPLHFVSQSSGFSWVPFGGFLGTEWQSGLGVFLEKSFYYGTAIWLLQKCPMRLVNAAAIVAGVLTAIEIAQIHLPGRTAEITDPLLAILLAVMLSAMARKTHSGVAG